MDEEKILSGTTDRNVTQLDTIEKALRGMLPAQRTMQRQQPGTRADGGMAPAGAPVQQDSMQDIAQRILRREEYWENALTDARRLVDNLEDEQIRLESVIGALEAKLSEERDLREQLDRRCEELKTILRQAATIMVNGGKE